jgi:hypothetical protein
VVLYFFDVNLSGQRLHPANDKAHALMATLKTTPAPTGATPSNHDTPQKPPKISENLDESPQAGE